MCSPASVHIPAPRSPFFASLVHWELIWPFTKPFISAARLAVPPAPPACLGALHLGRSASKHTFLPRAEPTKPSRPHGIAALVVTLRFPAKA